MNASAARCCQQDHAGEDIDVITRIDIRQDPASRWRCCKADVEPADVLPGGESMLESLSYTPIRFDEGSTIDTDRSHARYSKIVVHSTRARTQRRSKAWDDWLRNATAGRSIVLLQGASGADDQAPTAITKTPAMYYLDRDLSKLSILRQGVGESGAITLLVKNIQVICPARDFMLFFDQIKSEITESEQRRAVLLQYETEDSERRRVCLLEETEAQKDRFVKALTELWLEKRNDHSMWF